MNYCHLTTPEKHKRLSRLHNAACAAQRRISRLEARLEKAVGVAGEAVDVETHKDLRKTVSEEGASIHELPDSFGRIFWDQQSKALKMKSLSGASADD